MPISISVLMMNVLQELQFLQLDEYYSISSFFERSLCIFYFIFPTGNMGGIFFFWN